MTTTEIKEAIIKWFEDNDDIFEQCIEELDSYNGYLGDDRYYPMDELDEFYSGCNALEILERAYFGYDEDNYTTDSDGDKHYGPFCPNRNYFRFNGYGNLVSTDYKGYNDHLDSWFVEALMKNRGYIETIDDNPELSELFDQLENSYAEEV